MDLQNLINLSCIFTMLIHTSLSIDPKFEECAPKNCGNGPNISYPFWIPEKQESYCGYRNLEIKCNDDDSPILAISNDDYVIRDVSYAHQSFSLSKSALYQNTACPSPLHNFSLENTFFNYSPSHADVYFFYNCTSSPKYPTIPVQCASGSNRTVNYSFAVFHKEGLEETGFKTNVCSSLVHAPVDIEDGDEKPFKMNYTEILKMGFSLSWSSKNCSDCERSDGRCGSDDDEFICFCVDGAHEKTCDHGKGPDVRKKVIIVLGTAGASIVVMLIIFYFYRRRNKKKYAAGLSSVSRNISSSFSSATDIEKMGSYFGLHIFSNLELEEATNNFDTTKELGDGGFGTVYYGKLKDGRAVAVKRLYENNYKRVEQFMNEVEILTRLRHKNLVQLYGCTSRRSHELLLVYEYVCNGTVFDHLHGDRAKPGFFPWGTRLKIALETASALAYLHASDVIHRDVKTNNILLDSYFCVKVADFGLSRLFPLDVTHVSTAPQGTPGYVDPDYHQCYQLTAKSDVYSFGVVLIELISSKPAVDITRHRHEINLSNMAINKIQNHELHELVDPSLGFETDSDIHKMVSDVAELAFQCLQNDKDNRPCMGEVLERLTSIQSQNVAAMKPYEFDIPKDDVVLLKNAASFPLSPTSVAQKWHSSASTPYGSGLSNNAPKT